MAKALRKAETKLSRRRADEQRIQDDRKRRSMESTNRRMPGSMNRRKQG